ncbi:MAG: hypothetical protein NXH71_11150 [Erythrobacteraceae bacterium]|jgi:hypothetical protein|nr:hypothetical protein [Erythrobacteraceae bacterium]
MGQPRRDPLPPPFDKSYPAWLLPVLGGILMLIAVLGMTGAIKFAGQEDCEAKGGRFAAGPGAAKTCIFPDDEEPS